MNLEMKVLGIDPNANFRHPQLGLNRCPDNEAQWNSVTWQNGNEDGNGDPVKPTYAELVAASYPADYAQQEAIAGIYAPVEVDGKLYPADLESLAKYEVAKQARGRGALAKGIAVAVDGTVTKLSSAQAIDDFHATIEATVTARIAAVHDAI